MLFRILAERLKDKLGQSFVVENRPGASGNIGIDMVAKSTPDGYTLMLTSNGHTIARIINKAAQFDPVSAGAPAWIYTIARNLKIDRVRRAARAGEVDHDAELEYLVDPAEPVVDVMVRNDEADRIARALSSLSEEQSMAIRLSFIEERPHPEIAESLGIPLGTVKSRIRLAMNRLRVLLDAAK